MRIQALSRRPKVRVLKEIEYAGLTLNPITTQVEADGKIKALHDKECTILKLLIEAAPQIVTGESISYALWKDEPPESGVLRTHIYNLRKSLGELGFPTLLKTIRGKGYSLSISEEQ